MDEAKSIIIAVLITVGFGLIILIIAAGIGSSLKKHQSSAIQNCINAGNKAIPCVEAVLGTQR